MSLWLGWLVVGHGQSGDIGSATMLNSEGSPEGCSGWVDSEVVGLSLCRVHAWSLVAAVGSVIVATIVVIVVLLLPLAIFSMMA